MPLARRDPAWHIRIVASGNKSKGGVGIRNCQFEPSVGSECYFGSTAGRFAKLPVDLGCQMEKRQKFMIFAI